MKEAKRRAWWFLRARGGLRALHIICSVRVRTLQPEAGWDANRTA